MHALSPSALLARFRRRRWTWVAVGLLGTGLAAWAGAESEAGAEGPMVAPPDPGRAAVAQAPRVAPVAERFPAGTPLAPLPQLAPAVWSDTLGEPPALPAVATADRSRIPLATAAPVPPDLPWWKRVGRWVSGTWERRRLRRNAENNAEATTELLTPTPRPAPAEAVRSQRSPTGLVARREVGEWHVERRTESPRRIGLGHEDIARLVQLVGRAKVAVVANHTSVLFADVHPRPTHLVDTLLALGVNVGQIYAPEHGFRGDLHYGANFGDTVDSLTGLPVYSLHGTHRKPSAETMAQVQAVIFDLQDVGARFYTYLSTLALVMEAAAEAGIPVIVCDRPNPHGHHIAGPMLDTTFRSFVGKLPVPLVHGMTLGEMARMIQGEGWLPQGLQCDLTVLPCTHYAHSDRWYPPVPPSPNLPNDRAIALYPSLCLFEPTVVSVGRGTPEPFQMLGMPLPDVGPHAFTPVSIPGVAPSPQQLGIPCSGVHLGGLGERWTRDPHSFDLGFLARYHDLWNEACPDPFITSTGFFDRLAGTGTLRAALAQPEGLCDLAEGWMDPLAQYDALRQRYLAYPMQR